MMAYPVGDRHGASILTLVCVIVGGVALYRRRQETSLALLIAPLGLGLVAAFLGRYPYGGAPRIMQYAAPSICILAGLGLASLLARSDRIRVRRRALLGILAALGLLGLGLVARDLVKPYRVADDLRTREFARWFWTEKSRDGELACLKTDLGLSFQTGVSGGWACRQSTCSTSGSTRSGIGSTFDPTSTRRATRKPAAPAGRVRPPSCRCVRFRTMARGAGPILRAEANRDLRDPARQADGGLASRCLCRPGAGSPARCTPWRAGGRDGRRPAVLKLPNRSGQRGWAKIS